MKQLEIENIKKSAKRISSYINKTPIMKSQQLNTALGHEFYFKAECLQKVGSFKARGAINTLLWLKESSRIPKKIVAFSSGNHAQAVSWASKQLNLKSEIFMPKDVSKIKLKATMEYGAKVTLCETRQDAEKRAELEVVKGAFLLPPFDHDQVICGQGTVCLEALHQIIDPIDAVFAPCGGGGLLSGTVIAANGFDPKIQVIGSEPLQANDAAQSLKTNDIFKWKQSPDTLADGAKTLSVTPKTFHYLKCLDDFFEISEPEIIYWTQWLCHLLKLHLEPTSALGMAAANRWLKKQNKKKKILVILSGGNMDQKTAAQVWSNDFLRTFPKMGILI